MNAELSQLVDGIERLIAALDGHDADAIELANQGLTLSVGRLRALGGCHDTGTALAELDHALGLAEAARIRVNLLSDMAERRLDLIAKARPSAANSAAYGPTGKRRRLAQ